MSKLRGSCFPSKCDPRRNKTKFTIRKRRKMFEEGKHLVCGKEEQLTLSGEGKQLVKSTDDDRQGEKDQSALGTAHPTKSVLVGTGWYLVVLGQNRAVPVAGVICFQKIYVVYMV